MTPLPIEHAPTDGTRVLLHHNTRHFDRATGSFLVTGTKWQECRYIDELAETGSPAHWQPWTGVDKIRTTEHIQPEDALAWLPLPESSHRQTASGYPPVTANGRSFGETIWFIERRGIPIAQMVPPGDEARCRELVRLINLGALI